MSKVKVEKETKHTIKLLKRRKPNRSRVGDFFVYLFLIFMATVMAFPLVFSINSALKPLDELYQFPPKIFVRNPTLENFSDLFILMNDSWVPFSRYILNTMLLDISIFD